MGYVTFENDNVLWQVYTVTGVGPCLRVPVMEFGRTGLSIELDYMAVSSKGFSELKPRAVFLFSTQLWLQRLGCDV